MAFTVTLLPEGRQFLADADTTLLQAAEHAGIALPSSCRAGTCRTCRCRLLSGSIAWTIPWPGLSPDEKKEGWILPCVACARSDLTLEPCPIFWD